MITRYTQDVQCIICKYTVWTWDKIEAPVKCGRLGWWQGKWVSSVDQSGLRRTVHWP